MTEAEVRFKIFEWIMTTNELSTISFGKAVNKSCMAYAIAEIILNGDAENANEILYVTKDSTE